MVIVYVNCKHYANCNLMHFRLLVFLYRYTVPVKQSKNSKIWWFYCRNQMIVLYRPSIIQVDNSYSDLVLLK